MRTHEIQSGSYHVLSCNSIISMGGSGSFVAHGCFSIFGPNVLGGSFRKLTNLLIFIPVVCNFHSRTLQVAWDDHKMASKTHM